MCSDKGEVTLLLLAMKDGDEAAAGKLLPLVYEELHRLATAFMKRERPGHTLQPTALINEAYMRLAGNNIDWQSHQHFIAVAARVMRRILVDYARAHKAAIRGGDLRRVELDEEMAVSEESAEEILAIDEALARLQSQSPRQAEIVELRYFAGFSVEEVAKILEISPRSVKRDWREAKVWLFDEIHRAEAAHADRKDELAE
ncbi:MAG: sigma-70 family RNA polymerase sigma factor [Silvibacterium sp.]|nr:sigma-70 family RNA polymerase sigma factor [Silvibacterium sp.]